jgi:membrane dipeptidase
MKFFDAHCDTIQPVVETGADFLRDPKLHITLPGLRAANVCCQVFASWAWGKKYGERVFPVAMDLVRATRALCDAHPLELTPGLTGADVRDGCREGARTVVIAGLEGADALEGQAERISLFYDAGVRILTLSWGDTPFCGSTYGSGSGLTPEGRELVERCEDLGVMVDVSHTSDAGFAEVLRAARRPLVASHSSCRAVCPNPRNLTDDMIRSLAEAGGVMGIALGSGFLSADFYAREKPAMDEFFRVMASGEKPFEEAWSAGRREEARPPRPPLDLVVAHVKHAIDVGGEDCVGLGGDMDGVDSTPEGLDGVKDYPKIAELLLRAGLGAEQVEKVCWGNMARVFGDTLPSVRPRPGL